MALPAGVTDSFVESHWLMQTATLKYRATTSRDGYCRPDRTVLDMGFLYVAAVRRQEAATGCHRRDFSLKLRTAHLTELRANHPVYNRDSRRLLESVLKRVNTA